MQLQKSSAASPKTTFCECFLGWLARQAREEQHQPSRLDRGLQPPLSVPALAATFVALCRSHDTAMDEFKVCSATAGQ